ncbi:MAG: histidine phosphatase family protein [Desulfobacteraceae bacterium]|nr:histidine phosphatase family protein [Desulfobacteraceae bacterium]
MTSTLIHLIRHGEVHNPQKILYGRLPRFGLSANGRRQAQETATHLSRQPLAAIFSSPLLRARQTAAAILAFHPRIKLRITQALNEVHTVYEGVPGEQLDRKRGDIYTGIPPEFEQPEDIFRRVHAFFQRARRRFEGKQIAAVSHGDVIVFTVLWAKSWELTPLNKTRLRQAGYAAGYPAHASVTTLIFTTTDEEERPEVEYLQPWK